MQYSALAIPEVKLLAPKVFGDSRGFFCETYNEQVFAEALGQDVRFVQDNHSRSSRHVLRGLHYQVRHAQAKLVRVVSGVVFDVAVDMRRSSPTFGRWVGAILSSENQNQMWVPEGFAHGFLVLSETADFVYKTTDYWSPANERSVRWNDPALAVDWPVQGFEPVLSAKDQEAPLLADAECYD